MTDDLGPLEPDPEDPNAEPITPPGAAGVNPNPGHCRACDKPLENKRKQYCEEHRPDPNASKNKPKMAAAGVPSGASRSGRPAPVGDSRLAGLRKELADQLEVIGLMVEIPLPTTGTHVRRRSAAIAGKLVTVAGRNKRVLEFLQSGSDGLVFLMLAEEALGLATALRVDMNVANPHTRMSRALGVLGSYEEAIQARGITDPWPAYMEEQRRRQAEADAARVAGDASAVA